MRRLADLKSQGAAEWSALSPAFVVWQKVGAVYDAPGWLNLAGLDWVDLNADGEKMWAEAGN